MMTRYFIAICCMLIVACQSKPETKEAKANAEAPEKVAVNEMELTAKQLANASIDVDTVQLASINHIANLTGSIDVPPQNLVSITCPLGGYLKNTHLLPGEAVNKGQVVAIMEDPSYVQLQQDYLVSKAKLTFLRKEYARQQELSASEAGSRKVFEEVTSQLETEQINERSLAQKLAIIGINASKLTADNITRQINITSPITGFVTKVNVNVGRYVNPTDVLVELVDPRDIHASLTVYEKDINAIRKGQHVEITPLNGPDKKYHAEVLLVTRNLDDTRAGLVHCHFHKYEPELLPGMFINAKLELGSRQLPAIAESAVVRHQGKTYVFIQSGERRFKLTEVQTGEVENGKISLLNNNVDWVGQKVVTRNAFTLLGAMFNTSEEE